MIEREQLVDDLTRAKAALLQAEESGAAARRELTGALAIRDQLRRQAIEEAARAGARRSVRPEGPPARACVRCGHTSGSE